VLSGLGSTFRNPAGIEEAGEIFVSPAQNLYVHTYRWLDGITCGGLSGESTQAGPGRAVNHSGRQQTFGLREARLGENQLGIPEGLLAWALPRQRSKSATIPKYDNDQIDVQGNTTMMQRPPNHTRQAKSTLGGCDVCFGLHQCCSFVLRIYSGSYCNSVTLQHLITVWGNARHTRCRRPATS
jgi:hypothetical protein